MFRRKDGIDLPEIMTMPGVPESVQTLVDFVCTHAKEIGFEERRIDEVMKGIEEALNNVVRFACTDISGEITVTCTVHEMGALLVDILDSGRPFNMLVASTFPEAGDFTASGEKPSTTRMKKSMKNIEYRRDGKKNRNILSCVISQ